MELIEDIRRVENESDRLVAAAQHESDELIRAAREEAKRMIESTRQDCRQAEAQLLVEYEQQARAHIEKLREENQKQTEAVLASAKKTWHRAIQLIVDTIAGKR